MVQALLANSMVQPLWCNLHGASSMMQALHANSMVQALLCNLHGASSMVQAQGEMYIAYYALQHYITTVA